MDYQEIAVNEVLIYLGFSEVFEGQLFRSKHKKLNTSGCNSARGHQTEIKLKPCTGGIPHFRDEQYEIKQVPVASCLWNCMAFCSFGNLLTFFSNLRYGLPGPCFISQLIWNLNICICYCIGSYTNYYFVYTDRITSLENNSFLLMRTHEKKK